MEIKTILDKGWLETCIRAKSLATDLANKLPSSKGETQESQIRRTYCYTLYIRALTSFESMVILIKQGYVIEAATLARSCIENAIYMSALSEDIGLLKLLRADEAASSNIRLKDIIKTTTRISPDEPILMSMKAEQEAFEAMGGKKVTIKYLSEKYNMDIMHTYFKHLSAMAVHPSLSAIDGATVFKDGVFDLGEFKDEYVDNIVYITLTSSLTALCACMARVVDMLPEGQEVQELAQIMEKITELGPM